MRAYQLLQLKEGAPHGLVEEAYWILVNQIQKANLEESAYARQVGELNAAFEAVSHDLNERARSPQSTARNGGTPSGLLRWRWSGRDGSAPQQRSPYELLHVDEAASPEVIRLATAAVLARPPVTRAEREDHKELILACQTLSDPQRRGEYDSRMAAAVAATRLAGAPLVQPTLALPPISFATSVPSATSATSLAAPLAEEVGPPVVDAPCPASIAALDNVMAQEAPTEARSAAQVASGPASSRPALEPAPALESPALRLEDVRLRVASRVDEMPPESASEAAGATDDRPATRSFFSRVASILPHADTPSATAIEAVNDRLLALSTPDGFDPQPRPVTTTAAAPPAIATPQANSAALPFAPGRTDPHITFLAGVQAGTCISLSSLIGDDNESEALEIELAAATAPPARLRIWHHDGRFLMQHVDGAPISISGDALLLPIAVLDDGDEIETGVTTIRVNVVAHA